MKKYLEFITAHKEFTSETRNLEQLVDALLHFIFPEKYIELFHEGIADYVNNKKYWSWLSAPNTAPIALAPNSSDEERLVWQHKLWSQFVYENELIIDCCVRLLELYDDKIVFDDHLMERSVEHSISDHVQYMLNRLRITRYSAVIASKEVPNSCYLGFRGSCFMNLGKWKEAISDYEKAHELEYTAESALPLVYLLFFCPDVRYRNTARAFHLLTLSKGHTDSLLLLSKVHSASGDFAAAKATLKDIENVIADEFKSSIDRASGMPHSERRDSAIKYEGRKYHKLVTEAIELRSEYDKCIATEFNRWNNPPSDWPWEFPGRKEL